MAYTNDELASQFGYSSAFFNLSPDLKAILDQAVREQWTPDRFKAAFINTSWYKNNSQAYKQWNELKTRNPAEAQSQLQQKIIEVNNLATQMGIPLGAGDQSWIAEHALSGGWNPDQLKQQLVDNHSHLSGSAGQGQAGAIDSQIRQIANDYGVTISEPEIKNLTGGLLKGSMTQDNVTSYAKQMAMSKYAGMRGFLQEGFTVKQVASPYIQSYAQLLEQEPNAVQLNDPLLQKALQGTPDAKTGLPSMQSVYQFEQSVRQDQRWLTTKNAHDEVENTAMGVLRDWGIHS